NEVSQLIHKIGKYLEERTQFADAEQLYQRALKLDTQLYGHTHIMIVRDIANIATLYERQGKYELSEKRYREALFMVDTIGIENNDLVLVRNYIALLQKMERDAEEWKQRLRNLPLAQSPQIRRRTPINDNDERIIYNGEWQTREHEGDFNSDAHFTDNE